MWVLPLSSHVNEPWGMSITHCFDCALPTTCKADTVSAGAPKALQVCTLSRLINASLTVCYLASTKAGSHTQNWEWDFQLSQNCPISLFPSNPLPITICALHITQILWQMFLKSPLVKTMATPLQYYYLENPRDGGAWWAAVHGAVKSWTRLSDFTFTLHFHALQKEKATHSSVLTWRIPGMGEPGGLPSMGSHRVGHDWSDLAAAAACISGEVQTTFIFRLGLFNLDPHLSDHGDP